MPFNFFETHTLLMAVERLTPANSFLRDRYFPTNVASDVFATDDVLVEYKDGSKKLAPFVAPRKGGVTILRSGYTMERYINCKFGITEANDKLPKRLTDVPQDPNNPKTKIPLETMKKTYYAARGWDKNGIPTEKTLRRLKIK